jgi:hypothetical protein
MEGRKGRKEGEGRKEGSKELKIKEKRAVVKIKNVEKKINCNFSRKRK